MRAPTTRNIGFIAAVVALLAATLWGAAPTSAAPKSAVTIRGAVSGTSQTTVLSEQEFEQLNTVTVQGTYKNKPLVGTLTYKYRVLLRGPGIPASFPGGAVTQSATFTSNRGDLSSESSPYAVPVIGFECWPDSDPVIASCVDHNAVILVFGSGTGVFGSAGQPNGAGPDVWTMRVERTGTEDVVSAGTLSGGIGRAVRYCHTGQAESVVNPNPTAGTSRTTVSMTTSTGVCRDELGQVIPPTSALPGGPLHFEYGFNWDFVGVNQSQPIYPDLAATVGNAAGTMTGVVSDLYVIGPASVTTLTLGSLTLGSQGPGTGILAQYPFAMFRVFVLQGSPPPSTMAFTGDTFGILATY